MLHSVYFHRNREKLPLKLSSVAFYLGAFLHVCRALKHQRCEWELELEISLERNLILSLASISGMQGLNLPFATFSPLFFSVRRSLAETMRTEAFALNFAFSKSTCTKTISFE